MECRSAPELIAALRRLDAAPRLLAALTEVPGLPSYLVGGAVRDLRLGRTPHELDVCVDGDPAALAAALGGERRAHDRFDTSTVRVDGLRYDLARARHETYSRPGALPTVGPAGIGEDLQRRDFTINAMALGLSGPHAGELLAVAGAERDLDAGVLRVLHDVSFRDDPTRLLRLVRYAARLGLRPDPETRRLAQAALAGGALDTVSGTRIGNELRALAAEPDPVAALTALTDAGGAEAILAGFGLAGADAGRARRALVLLPAGGRGDRLVIGVAAERVAPGPLRPALDALGFAAADRDVIGEVAAAAELTERLRGAHTPSAIAGALAGAAPEAVAAAGAGGGPDAERGATAWLQTLRHVGLEIDGGDLRAAGVAEGPAIGIGLRAALAAKLDGRAGDRDAELSAALAAARAEGS